MLNLSIGDPLSFPGIQPILSEETVLVNKKGYPTTAGTDAQTNVYA